MKYLLLVLVSMSSAHAGSFLDGLSAGNAALYGTPDYAAQARQQQQLDHATRIAQQQQMMERMQQQATMEQGQRMLEQGQRRLEDQNRMMQMRNSFGR